MRSLNVRLPEPIYDGAAKLAKEQGRSLNSVISDAVQRAIREREERDLFDAFTILGQDGEEVDIEYAFPAQAEVVLRDKS